MSNSPFSTATEVAVLAQDVFLFVQKTFGTLSTVLAAITAGTITTTAAIDTAFSN